MAKSGGNHGRSQRRQIQEMKVILDCNIWISFLIGHQAKSIQQILTDTRFDVYICDELLEEIHDVCSRPKIRTRISDEELDDFFRIIS